MDSELRQDLVSGDWIVIALGRAKRPQDLIKKTAERIRAPKDGCPLEDPQASGNEPPSILYKREDGEWELQVVPNKFPALRHDKIVAALATHGPYSVLPGIGRHDLVITRDHDASFPELTPVQAQQVFRAFRERYHMLAEDPYLAYMSIFHNWGPTSGATLYHPHYQILAVPVIPPDVGRSLEGSRRYFMQHNICVHCVILEAELKERTRIIYENAGAVAFAPFVSREPFEVRVFPRHHAPYVEDTPDAVMGDMADALQHILKKFEKNLYDPDYNFFIHTAPLQQKDSYSHYHWHIEVLPKISISAGFELSTGIEITVVDPDEAAKILRE